MSKAFPWDSSPWDFFPRLSPWDLSPWDFFPRLSPWDFLMKVPGTLPGLPSGKKSQGKKSQGKKPQGKKSQGKKSQGKKSQGKESQGRRSGKTYSVQYLFKVPGTSVLFARNKVPGTFSLGLKSLRLKSLGLFSGAESLSHKSQPQEPQKACP